MICYHCFREVNMAKPLRFNAGYLMACDSCYIKRKIDDIVIAVAACIILLVAAYAVFSLWNSKIGIGRYGLCFLIAYYAIVLLRNFPTLLSSNRIKNSIFQLRQASPDDNFINLRKKIGAMIRVSLMSIIHLCILAVSWFCYFKFGDLLSNGKNPDNYVSVVKHFGGGNSTSSPAWLFDVDPLPIIVLIMLIIFSIAYFWYIWLFHIGDLVHFAIKHTAANSNDLLIKQTAMGDFKVYRDPQFSEVHESHTRYLFIDPPFDK